MINKFYNFAILGSTGEIFFFSIPSIDNPGKHVNYKLTSVEFFLFLKQWNIFQKQCYEDRVNMNLVLISIFANLV